MGNPYPAKIVDANAEVRLAGQVNFTDPANQPGAAVPAIQVQGPYTVNYNTPGLTDAYVLLNTLTVATLLVSAVAIVTQTWDAMATFEVVFDPDTTNTPMWTHELTALPTGTGQWPSTNCFAGVKPAGTKVACDAFGAVGLTSGQVDVYVYAFPLA